MMSLHQQQGDSDFVALRRHEDFYLTGGDLFFLVEHNQFRVHRYFFERESAFFRGKLTTPASPGAHRQGTSESTSIVLDGVRSSEFARFLWVFYNPKYSLYETTAEDWTAILDLAHRWSFPEVKSLAVRELEKLELPDIDRIVTYHKYDVDRTLLIPRYAALVQREQPLSLPEGMRLGMETTLTIARARECARASPSAAGGLRSPSPTNIGREEMFGIVKDIFGITPEVDEPAAAATASGSSPTTQKDPVVTQTKPTATPPAAVATASAAPAAAPIATPVITPVTTKTEPSANTNGAPVGVPLTQTTSNGDGTVTPSLDADGSDVDPLIRVDSPISRGGRPSGARRGTRGGRP